MGLKKIPKNLRGPKNFHQKIRGLKKIDVFWKNAPSGYPEEKMTDPLSNPFRSSTLFSKRKKTKEKRGEKKKVKAKNKRMMLR